jgi:hypothetical protein
MKDVISPIDTDSGLFQDGDPATGAEGTIVSAKWLNDMQAAEISTQKEIISILTEAGLKPDAAATNQLLTAIKAVLTTGLKGALLSENNLSDLKDVEDAHKNLELGKLALKDSLTAGDVGALPTSGGNLTGIVSTSAEIRSTLDNNFRMVNGNRGIFWRLDQNSLYIMMTADGDQFGNYNDARPIRVDLATGDVYINDNKPYSNANKPSADAIGGINGDACNQAGFVSQNSQDPYMMYGGNTIIQLAPRSWVSDQISVVQNWASNDLRNDIYNWCNQSFVTAVRLGSERVQASTNDSGGVVSLAGGELLTGAAGTGGSDFNKAQWRVRQLQYLINGQWVAAGSA